MTQYIRLKQHAACHLFLIICEIEVKFLREKESYIKLFSVYMNIYMTHWIIYCKKKLITFVHISE